MNFAVPPAADAEKDVGAALEADDGDGGGKGRESVKALLDVTRLAGVDLKSEAASLEAAGADDDEEVGARTVQPESLVVTPEAVRASLLKALSSVEGGAAMRVDENVHALVAHATHERLRALLEQLVLLSAHRHDAGRTHFAVSGERDTRRQLKLIEKREREAKERRDEEERERLLRETREQEAALKRQKGEGTAEALQEARDRLNMMKNEDEDLRRTKSTNTTASLAIGERRKITPVVPLPPLPSAAARAAAVVAGGLLPAPATAPSLSMEQLKELKDLQELLRAGKALSDEQRRVLAGLQAQLQRRALAAPRAARRITKKDLLTLLNTEPALRTSRLMLAPRGKLTSDK